MTFCGSSSWWRVSSSRKLSSQQSSSRLRLSLHIRPLKQSTWWWFFCFSEEHKLQHVTLFYPNLQISRQKRPRSFTEISSKLSHLTANKYEKLTWLCEWWSCSGWSFYTGVCLPLSISPSLQLHHQVKLTNCVHKFFWDSLQIKSLYRMSQTAVLVLTRQLTFPEYSHINNQFYFIPAGD